MDDPRDGSVPRYPLARSPLIEFLAGPGGALVAELDASGGIVQANARLARRMPLADRVALVDVLTARSGQKFRDTWSKLIPGGPAIRRGLRFRGEGPTVSHVCLLHREADGTGWLFGLPRIDAEGLGAARELAREVEAMHRTMGQSDRLFRLVEQARVEARTDPLTGLANRRQGMQWFRHAVSRAKAGGTTLCCLIVDIDDFKLINDTYGHPVGDRVLQRAAHLFRENLRPQDRIFRYGGEEFVILLPETDLDGGRGVADRLRRLLHDEHIRPLDNPLSASFGVAELRGRESSSSVMTRADHALMRAKHLGRNRVEFDP